MSLTEDITAPSPGRRAWIERRIRDAVVLLGGLILALPLIVPFA